MWYFFFVQVHIRESLRLSLSKITFRFILQLVSSAIKPDVLVVAYEYIGTTLESLLYRIEETLAGSSARYILKIQAYDSTSALLMNRFQMDYNLLPF